MKNAAPLTLLEQFRLSVEPPTGQERIDNLRRTIANEYACRWHGNTRRHWHARRAIQACARNLRFLLAADPRRRAAPPFAR